MITSVGRREPFNKFGQDRTKSRSESAPLFVSVAAPTPWRRYRFGLLHRCSGTYGLLKQAGEFLFEYGNHTSI